VRFLGIIDAVGTDVTLPRQVKFNKATGRIEELEHTILVFGNVQNVFEIKRQVNVDNLGEKIIFIPTVLDIMNPDQTTYRANIPPLSHAALGFPRNTLLRLRDASQRIGVLFGNPIR